MVDHLHDNALRRSASFEARDGRHARAMEAQVGQADSFQEFVPVKRNHIFLLGSKIGHCLALFPQLYNQRNQAGIQCSGVVLVAFRMESDLHVAEIDVTLKVQVSFGDPAALGHANFECDSENMGPIVLGYRSMADDTDIICWVLYCLPNYLDFFFGDFLFWARSFFSQSKSKAGVMIDDSPGYGLSQNDPQVDEIQQRVVMRAGFDAFRWRPAFSPAQISEAVAPLYFSRVFDLKFAEIIVDVFPAASGAAECIWHIVFCFEERWNPIGEGFSFGAADYFCLFGSPEITFCFGFTPIFTDAYAEFGGELFDRTGFGIAPLDPPERAAIPFVKAGHKKCNLVYLVSPDPQMESNKINVIQSLLKTVILPVWKRGFESLSLRHFITNELRYECNLSVPSYFLAGLFFGLVVQGFLQGGSVDFSGLKGGNS